MNTTFEKYTSMIEELDDIRAEARGPLTLGRLLTRLEQRPRLEPVVVEWRGVVVSPGSLESYRGYYESLAITVKSSDTETRYVHNVVNELRRAIGKTYTGWKGGDFVMSRNTLMFVDEDHGASGMYVTDVHHADGLTVLVTESER